MGFSNAANERASTLVQKANENRTASLSKTEQEFWDKQKTNTQQGMQMLRQPLTTLTNYRTDRDARAVSSISCAEALFEDPSSQKGWVSFTTPDGRTFWHHSALGPAPWETTPLLASKT